MLKMIKLPKKLILIFGLFIILPIIAFSQNDYARAHLWEKEIKTFAELDKREFPEKNGVLFVGSSSIRGWRTVADDFPDFRTINRGFGGSHLEDVNFYAEQIVFPYKPKLIVLYAGENDLVAGKSIERVFSDFKNFVSIIHKRLPKTRLIFVSLKPSPARREFTAKFMELNDLIEAETKKDKRLSYVDVWSPMLDANGQPKKEIFQNDKLHINAEGYKIWRAALLAPIKKGLKGSFR
jgi:lysophospholipase L1-like esterase